MLRRSVAACVVVGAVVVTACDGTPVTAPASQAPPSLPPPAIGAPLEINLSGSVTTSDGAPVPGAKVDANFEPATFRGAYQASATTDAAGRYQMTFVAVVGRVLESTALMTVSKDGFETDVQRLNPTSSKATFNAVLLASPEMSVGEAVEVTVTTEAPLCTEEDWPLSGYPNCRRIVIAAPSSGELTVETVPPGSNGSPPRIWVWTSCCSALGNPATIPVKAGARVNVVVEVPRSSPTRTFVVRSRYTG